MAFFSSFFSLKLRQDFKELCGINLWGYRVFKTYLSPVQCKHDNPELELPTFRRKILWVTYFLVTTLYWLWSLSFFVCSCYLFFFAVISRSCDLPFYFMHSVRIKLNVWIWRDIALSNNVTHSLSFRNVTFDLFYLFEVFLWPGVFVFSKCVELV